jgi:DNA repair protein RecO (recombination protein O)
MIQNTRAFILSYLKYGDSSLIIKCYTKEHGFKSFILKNSFSKKLKKNHLLLVLNEVDLTFYTKKNGSLELIKDISQGYLFHTLHTDIIKSSIITFIGEILNQILRNEETQDFSLYIFIQETLIFLDRKEKQFADFHLYFLLAFSRHIGFYPLAINPELPFFNLKEGIFSLNPGNTSKEENARLWNILLNYDFKTAGNCFSSAERSLMLEEMLAYYEMHLAGFKRPLSLDILKLIFN